MPHRTQRDHDTKKDIAKAGERGGDPVPSNFLRESHRWWLWNASVSVQRIRVLGTKRAFSGVTHRPSQLSRERSAHQKLGWTAAHRDRRTEPAKAPQHTVEERSSRCR